VLGKREGGVCARPYSLRVRKSAVCTCCVLYRKCENSLYGVSGKAYVKKDGDTDKEAEASRSASVSQALLCLRRSLFPASHFVVRVSPLLFAFPSSTALVNVHRAHQRGSVGTCSLSISRDWDGHGRSVGRLIARSVGRCMCSRRPR